MNAFLPAYALLGVILLGELPARGAPRVLPGGLAAALGVGLALGEPYAACRARTRRLIPFVW